MRSASVQLTLTSSNMLPTVGNGMCLALKGKTVLPKEGRSKFFWEVEHTLS